MFKKKLKRILSMFMASAVTAASVCAGAAVLPHNAVPVQAAEMPALVRTYNMVRLDDVLGVKNSSNHNYNPKYDSTYGFLTSCSHGPSDGGNYWSRYPASIYGYYDEVIGTWVQTTLKVWANEAYDLDDGHTCGEWPDKIMRYKAMPDGLSGCHITTRPCDNQLLRGASFVFSDPDNMTGTVTVYYAEECTVVSALNDSFVLSMGGEYQDVTIQNADGSAAQTIYTSRYSNVQFVSSSGHWMSSWADEDRTITYRNEVYDISPQRWELLDAGGGYVYIKREGGNGYLTVTGNSAGSVLRSERFNGSDYQKFRIVRSGTQITFHPENSGTDTVKIAKYGTGDASTGVIGLTNGTYEFQGWYTGKSGTGEKVYDASGLAVKGTYWSADGTSASWQSRADSLDLYAYWQPGKATQTLYFYRDGTKDDAKTKTYSASIGSTFDAESHKGDSTFEHCHFVKIDKSSWKVTGAASTNVYYETDKLSVSYNGNGATSGSTAGSSIKYGAVVTAAQNGFARTGFSFVSWNTKADGTGTYYRPGETFTAQPAVHNEKKILYAIWKDVTAPAVSVSPETASDWVSTVQIKITASDNDKLSVGTSYRYCLTENSSVPDGTWGTYTNGSSFAIGQTLSGTYYLWVEGVSDASGNTSSSTGYHRFGPYLFDNSAPDTGSVKNSYGRYDEGSSATIDFDITDSHSGIKSITLRDINDVVLADITGGSHQYTFDVSGVNFYSIVASDNLGNVSKKMFAVKIGISPEPVHDGVVWKGLHDIVLYRSWLPVTYTIIFSANDNDGGAGACGVMSDLPVVYDTSVMLPANGYSRDGYTFTGWNTGADGTGMSYADQGTVKNLTAVQGGKVTLYAQWKDASAPELSVTPTETVNPDVENNAVKSIDVTITIAEKGSGLSPDNHYEYGFSTSITTPPDNWSEYCSSPATDSFSTTLNGLGSSETGFYYLWVKQIKDRYGNLSSGIGALATIASCHVYGVYVFDNTAPSGTAEYIENNATLGLYNEVVSDSPYAVMTIYNPKDDISGIEGYTLRVSDASDSSVSTELSFIPDGSTYICKFNLYDSLPNAESIEQVHMKLIARDKLGNEATIPTTRYDFGTLQTGMAIKAEDIGYKNVGTADNYEYERDNFRVEAFIEAVNGGTQFKAGQWGYIRIYTFGYIDAVEINFGSLMNYYNTMYDINPTLQKTTVNKKLSLMHTHEFAVPLYCVESSFNDTKVMGHKDGSSEYRYVVYNIKGSILDDIRTILKYKIY